jgi:putative membrane protein
MDYDYGSMHGSGWGLMVLMMLVFWGLLVALVVWLLRSTRTADPTTTGVRRTGSPSPEDVLAHRYARGEIDEDEFERRRAALERAAAGL